MEDAVSCEGFLFSKLVCRWRKLTFITLVLFLFCPAVRANSFASPAGGDCFAEFSKNPYEVSDSFIAVLDYALQQQLLKEDFVKAISESSFVSAQAKLQELPNGSQVMSLKNALLKLLENPDLQTEWTAAQSGIQKILIKQTAETQQRQKANTSTEFAVTGKLKTINFGQVGQVLRSTEWHVTADGRALMAMPKSNETLIFNFNDLKHPMHLDAQSSYAPPQWHTSRKGEALLAISGEGTGAVVVYNFTTNAAPKTFRIAQKTSSPSRIRTGAAMWYQTADGTDLIAFIGNNQIQVYDYESGKRVLFHKGHYGDYSDEAKIPAWESGRGGLGRLAAMNGSSIEILQVGKAKPILSLKIDDSADPLIRPAWSQTTNGDALILTARKDNLFIFNLTHPGLPTRVALEGDIIASPVVIRTAKGEAFYVIRTSDHVYLVGANDLEHPHVIADGDFEYTIGKVSAFVNDHHTLLAVPLAFSLAIYDLDNIDYPISVKLPTSVWARPAWYVAPDGTGYVSVPDTSLNLHLIEVFKYRKRP